MKLAKEAIKYTRFALGLIIGGLLTPTTSAVLEFCLLAADDVRKYDPYTKALSYKTKKYYHKKKGWWVSNRKAVKKNIATVYTKKNYKGSTSKKTFYEIHEFDQ